jgi:hypothetical protein
MTAMRETRRFGETISIPPLERRRGFYLRAWRAEKLFFSEESALAKNSY